ncbi:hypothetical protein BDR07DRAFT_1451275 [Suillus spraguei]|nr:hypothetical protein BDR07DRAFT_1451275 [Suillus spraguei]
MEVEHGWECPADPVLQDIDASINNFEESDVLGVAEQQEAEKSLDNVWAPFVSCIDYEVAKWAKLCGSGSTAFSELLAVEGLHDTLGLSYQNTHELNQIIDQQLPCRRPCFKHEEIVVADEAIDVYSHDVMECIKAFYSDPEFSQHLNYTPKHHYNELEAKKPGATVIPIILSSDKMQVTMFRNKSAYPVYMTIGNILKEILWILLAYLKLDHITNKAARRRTATNLFHACLYHILEPLQVPGEIGVPMASGDGVLLTTGIKSGECPKYLPECGIKPIFKPFWLDLLHTNIFQSITPDMLHQLYQGIIKHLIEWIKEAYSSAKIDAHCHQLPPNHNICLFLKGISSLSRVSGMEHNQICCFLLDQTLALLDDALTHFHDNKDIFLDLGICSNFNLLKLHGFRHYAHMIKMYGTTDNYNTEYTEHLHINLTKDTYRATNRKDEYKKSLPDIDYHQVIKMTKHPTVKRVQLDHIIQEYGATFFTAALAHYIVRRNQPEAAHIILPFDTVATFHQIKFNLIDAHGIQDSSVTVDSVHCQPFQKDKRGHMIPACFDTVLVQIRSDP